jgi:hypothetical protein
MFIALHLDEVTHRIVRFILPSGPKDWNSPAREGGISSYDPQRPEGPTGSCRTWRSDSILPLPCLTDGLLTPGPSDLACRRSKE